MFNEILMGIKATCEFDGYINQVDDLIQYTGEFPERDIYMNFLLLGHELIAEYDLPYYDNTVHAHLTLTEDQVQQILALI